MEPYLKYLPTLSPDLIVMISGILASIVILSVLAAVFYYAGVEPARMTERWLGAVANGENAPQRPNVGFRYWLLPVHRELVGLEKRFDEQRKEMALVKERLAQTQFLHNYILSSVIEAIVVVDERREVTLVNSEFMHLYQLTQSPMGCTVSDVAEDQRIDQLVEMAFSNQQVQSGRITKALQGDIGRHPAYNVSAIPVSVSDGRISAVIVMLLPLADRPRMVQVMKRHAERMHRLLNHRALPAQYSVENLEKFECSPFVINDATDYSEFAAFENGKA